MDASLFENSSLQGLSQDEARNILLRDGYNDLPEAARRTTFQIVLEVFFEPMFLLLISCATVYLVLGDRGEALMLFGFVVFIAGLTVYQNRKTERALDALRRMSSPRALVIRDGQQMRIMGREVVRGDLLILAEGDRVPADAVLVDGGVLEVDESLLTGESLPVRKTPRRDLHEIELPGSGGHSSVYSGTLVVKGKGIARVLETGSSTYLGRIGKALNTIVPEDTPLKRATAFLVKFFFFLGILLCLAVAVVYGLTRDGWLQGILAGITLAMAIIPEEFPVVLSVFLTLGAWRIAKRNVLTRNSSAVEALGAASVLCVDKTGTLTQNQMTVSKIAVNGQVLDISHQPIQSLPETFHELVEFSILASRVEPFDPMEKAFHRLGQHYLVNTEHLHQDWILEREYPLSDRLLAMSHVWRSPDRKEYVIAAKGAPEAVADLCHLEPSRLNQIAKSVDALASEGLRVLGVARAVFRESEMPTQQHDFNFQFLGLIGLTDPIRPLVKDSLQECTSAGVQVVMITGDYPATASHVAKEIGLDNPDTVMSGADLGVISQETLTDRIDRTNIFARMMPEQKFHLVKALKSLGKVVAMTGDGVNDAPALREAHIGIAMGNRGSDVARESADLVLLDDDFSSIVRAIRLGRRIFDNIQKAFAYIIAIHVPVAGLSLVPVLLRWPLALFPVHIVFVELLIDPACSIVFENEPEEADVMARPPRNPNAPLISRSRLTVSLLQGFGVLLMALGVFHWGLNHLTEADARTLAFVTLVFSNFALIVVNRSWSKPLVDIFRTPNPAMWWVIGCGTFFLCLVVYTPLRHFFHLSSLHPFDMTVVLVVAFSILAWSEFVRRLAHRLVDGAQKS